MITRTVKFNIVDWDVKQNKIRSKSVLTLTQSLFWNLAVHVFKHIVVHANA